MLNRQHLLIIVTCCILVLVSINILCSNEYSTLITAREPVRLTHVILSNDTPIEKQMSREDAIYVVNDIIDLGALCNTVMCNKKLEDQGSVYYYDSRKIHLEKGQSIVLPRNNIILDSKLRILSKGYYKAERPKEVYLASIVNGEFDYWIGKELIVPARCVVKFEGGTITNGIINMSGSIVESYPLKVFHNSIVRNIGNNEVPARWFLEDGDLFVSTIIDNIGNKEIDYGGLSLVSINSISLASANWKNLKLTSPQIIIGNENPIKTPIAINKPQRKDEYADSHLVEVEGDLSDYKGKIILLSTGEPVDFDCREENEMPTLYKGITTVIEESHKNYIVIEDFIDSFEKEYDYTSKNHKVFHIQSKGYIYEPCKVRLDNCTFISSKRTNPGFMYVKCGKDLSINNCQWDGGQDGSPSLLGINACVNGTIQNCSFSNSYYEGTITSYGLQLFNSTRIKTSNCTFKNNRRGYDVSGNKCQTRYCIIDNSNVVGAPIVAEGSGLGGHSTSYGNIFRNNIIEGSSGIIGIQTRGDKEIIEGNIFYGKYKTATITCVKNTIIRNNVSDDVPSSSFVWIESSSDDTNEIVVEGNRYAGVHLVRGQKVLKCNVIIRDNSFRYTSPKSSIAPTGDNVIVNCSNNRLSKAVDKAILYYKLDTTNPDNEPMGVGARDKVDISISKQMIIN